MTSKSIAKDVQNVIDGIDLLPALKRLAQTGQAGVGAALRALEGKFRPAPEHRHGRDVHEDLISVLWSIATVDPSPLLTALEANPQHAQYLIWGLAASKDKRAIDALVQYATFKDVLVRWAAIHGLARLNRKSLLPTFIKALHDRSSEVQFSALLALEKIADATAIEPLKRYLARKNLEKHSPGGKQVATKLLAKLQR